MGIQKLQRGGNENSGAIKTLNQASSEMVELLEECKSTVLVDMAKGSGSQAGIPAVKAAGNLGTAMNNNMQSIGSSLSR